MTNSAIEDAVRMAMFEKKYYFSRKAMIAPKGPRPEFSEDELQQKIRRAVQKAEEKARSDYEATVRVAQLHYDEEKKLAEEINRRYEETMAPGKNAELDNYVAAIAAVARKATKETVSKLREARAALYKDYVGKHEGDRPKDFHQLCELMDKKDKAIDTGDSEMVEELRAKVNELQDKYDPHFDIEYHEKHWLEVAKRAMQADKGRQ